MHLSAKPSCMWFPCGEGYKARSGDLSPRQSSVDRRVLTFSLAARLNALLHGLFIVYGMFSNIFYTFAC